MVVEGKMRQGKNKKHLFSRREAIRVGSGALALSAIGFSPPLRSEDNRRPGETLPKASGPGHVVKVHMPGMRSSLFPHPVAARQLVDQSVCALAKETDPGRAWGKFLSSTDRVGIKINCLGTRMASSMQEVVFAIADSIRDFGIQDSNIVIFDMFASNMMGGRYTQQTNPTKMRILAHRNGTYQKSWIKSGPARAKFSDILLWTTAIINVPPIKDHDLAGVTCTMKNMSFGTVEKPHINHNTINESIPYLWALEEIRSRVRINIIDGSTILYDGGPKNNRSALVPHECVYATTDPVAMDAIAYELIELLRAENKMRTLAEVGRPPKYLELAQSMGLGIADRNLINLETVDLPMCVGKSS